MGETSRPSQSSGEQILKQEMKTEKKRSKKKENKKRKDHHNGELVDDLHDSSLRKKKLKATDNHIEKKEKKEKKKKKERRSKDKQESSLSKIETQSTCQTNTTQAPETESNGKNVDNTVKHEDSQMDAFLEKHRISVTPSDFAFTIHKSFDIAAASMKKSGADVCLKWCSRSFQKPTPVQSVTWPLILGGNDVVGIAETGSGKTLSFVIPCIDQILSGKCGPGGACRPRGLVLAPTRELAMQSAKIAEDALKACDKLSSAVVFGGTSKWNQRKELELLSTLDILIATPGRLIDFIEGKVIDISHVHYLVLDEADRMLDLGFEMDVRKIIAKTVPSSEGRQTVMFSATWPTQIRQLAQSFMKNPVKVIIGGEKLAASRSVKQNVQVMDGHEKETKLLDLLGRLHKNNNRIIVFALYKKEAARLENLLRKHRYRVAGVHGDKAQSDREDAVRKFDRGESPILVATDVASRGLDIKGVEYVINVSFPLTIEDYVHRIGRTGRAGSEGEAFTFFTSHDKHLAGALQNILREANESIPPELSQFGNTVKKKEHALYGSHFRKSSEAGEMKKAQHVTFDDQDDD